MRALIRLLVLGVLVVVLVVIVAPSLLGETAALRDKVPSLVDERGASKGRQSAAQVSAAEFAGVADGLTFAQLRGLVGEPESKARTELEGIELECWYYGIVGESGAYQFCFRNGRLATKFRYTRA